MSSEVSCGIRDMGGNSQRDTGVTGGQPQRESETENERERERERPADTGLHAVAILDQCESNHPSQL
jgi:hypothetical protein